MTENNLYVFSCPNAMVNHNYTDDVALCWAASKDKAIIKFAKLYDINHLTSKQSNIREIKYTDGVVILTDY